MLRWKKKKKPYLPVERKIDLPDVTLVALASTKVDETIRSMLYSSRNIIFSEIVLISHERPVSLPQFIKYREIDRIKSYERYNYHVAFSLAPYIKTTHALLVQHDGFVVNTESWDDKFLRYDYIGAPWPLPRDDFSYRDDLGRLVRVGNGGFSLRSKVLLDAPQKLGLIWEPFHGYFHEDGFLCAKNRSILEDFGIKFAPIDVAATFSFETEIDENKGHRPFGTHGVKNLRISKRQIDLHYSRINGPC